MMLWFFNSNYESVFFKVIIYLSIVISLVNKISIVFVDYLVMTSISFYAGTDT